MKNLVLLSFLICVSYIACYTPADGCLEYWATNYDVSADSACESCCVEPTLNVNIKYIYPDSSSYVFGDTLLHSSGKYYHLLSSNIFLDSFEVYTSSDLFPLTRDTSQEIRSVFYRGDFGFSERQGSSIALGTYQDPDYLVGMTASLGLPSILQDTSIFGLDNILVAKAIDSLYVAEQDVFAIFKCSIALDTLDIDTIHLTSSYTLPRSLALSFDSIALNTGKTTTLNWYINVEDWLNHLDLTASETASWADTLVSNLTNASFIDK
jgi:hypothetical protein